jgi:hypothetical protein
MQSPHKYPHSGGDSHLGTLRGNPSGTTSHHRPGLLCHHLTPLSSIEATPLPRRGCLSSVGNPSLPAPSPTSRLPLVIGDWATMAHVDNLTPRRGTPPAKAAKPAKVSVHEYLYFTHSRPAEPHASVVSTHGYEANPWLGSLWGS